jgi:hypothetical protein
MKAAQVGVLRRRRMAGKTQKASAAAAGMSVGSTCKWEHGLLPSQRHKPEEALRSSLSNDYPLALIDDYRPLLHLLAS